MRDEEPRRSGSDSKPVNEVNAKAKRDSHPVRTRRAGENEVSDRLIPLFRLKKKDHRMVVFFFISCTVRDEEPRGKWVRLEAGERNFDIF